MTQSDFDKRLGDMLRRTADAMPSSDNLSQRIHHRILQEEKAKPMRKNFHSLRVPINGISILVLVALFAGVLTYIHAQHTPSRSASTVSISSASVGTPGIIGQVAPVTDQGITLQVISAFADPLATEVQVAISGTNPQMNDPEFSDPTLTITDNSGKSFTYTYNDLNMGSKYSSTNPRNEVGTLVYLPLPVQQLGEALHATFIVHNIALVSGEKPPSSLSPLVGRWESAFNLNPTQDKIYTFHTPTITQQGIGIQLQSLETVTANQAAENEDGIRIILTITGLPANTLIQGFYGWWPYTTSPPINGTVCSVPPCNKTINLPRALLTIPGFVVHAGNGVSFPLLPGSTSTQTVGESRTTQVELLYMGQGTFNETGTLIISNLQITLATNGTQTKELMPGTWTLEIPIR